MTQSEEVRVWGIHTRDDALFLQDSVIAIGRREMGDLRNVGGDRGAFKKRYTEAYPNAKRNVFAYAGIFFRFVREAQVGDYVVFPSKSDRKINIGVIEGDYTYEPSAPEYVHRRKVKWLKHLPRTSFSQGALHEIGSAMSFFAVKNYADEYLAALDRGFKREVTPMAPRTRALEPLRRTSSRARGTSSSRN